MIKLEFKEYNEADWQDWTLYLIDYSDVNKMIESELDADVGVIVFDSISLTMKLESPLTDYFNEVYLTASKKLMFRISKVKKLSNDYVRMFEGIVDLESIEFDDDFPYVSFDVLDKLSYLNKVERTNCKSLINLKTAAGRGLPSLNYADGEYYELHIQGTTDLFVLLKRFVRIGGIITEEIVDQSLLKALYGEVLAVGDKYYFVKASGLVDSSEYPGTRETRLKHTPGNDIINGVFRIDTADFPYQIGGAAKPLYVYTRGLFGRDFENISLLPIGDAGSANVNTVTSFSGVLAIKAISSLVIPNIELVDRTSSVASIPLYYFKQLIFDSPFGENPLDALKFLADTLLLYAYFDKNGRLVVAQKTALTAGTSRTISPDYISRINKKFFWKTPADAIELTAKSFLVDGSGNYIEVTVNFQSNPDLKPKNVIKKTIICNDTLVTTEQNLIDWAEIQAEAYLDFYKVKRCSIQYTLTLNDDTINWDLLDRIGTDYFFSAISFDLDNNVVELEAVEIEGIVW